MKKYFLISLLLGFLLFSSLIFASSDKLPTVYLFHGEECPHCKVERNFLEKLKSEIPGLEVVEYEVWHNEENRKLFLETVKKFNIETSVVPLTIVGDKYLIGFDTPENYGEKIREMILPSKETTEASSSLSIPLLGKIDLKTASLPFLTVVIGILDGFNPCSMWALLVLLTLVIASGSRKKVWLAGSVFIITSAISYFLFMSAWLNAFIFFDYLMITRIIVGVVAIGAGIISIKEFYTFKPNICEVSSPEKQQKISKRIEKVVGSATLPLMILGIMGIAFSVNLIELFCSLGLPVVYTKTLAMHHLSTWKYYGYIGLYDFFYMLVDIIFVLIVGFSMKLFHFNSTYSRWSRLVAGILMFILGAIFLIKPELLMFK